MDLSRLGIVARIRTAWEAMDLGFVLARAWWRPLFLSWFIPSFCVFVPLLLLFGESGWIPWFVIWWLKPLFDRGPLYIASRRLFGEPAGTRTVLRQLFSLYKKDWFLWLTFRRLSVTRCYDMPLTVLEELKGDKRRARQNILHRGYSSPANWLTVVGVHLEGFLAMGFYALLVMLVPEQVDIDYFKLLTQDGSFFVYLSTFTTYLVMVLVGPFYALGGFAMYISRRIELEAWDIEIRFRHLAATQEAKEFSLQEKIPDDGKGQGVKKILPVLLVVGLIGLTSFSPFDVIAQESIDEYTASNVYTADESDIERYIESDSTYNAAAGLAPKQKILDILEGKEFRNIETQTGLRFKDVETSDEVPGWLISLIEFFEEHHGAFKFLADIISYPFEYLEYFLIGLLILIIAFVIYKYRKPIKNFWEDGNKNGPEHEKPKVMFGLDVTRESLPDDVPTEVRSLWEKQQFRQAVSLLYRALLAELIHRHGFAFADSDTEGECVATVRKRGESPLSRYTMALTSCWQNLAYGHVLPASHEIEALCRDWPEVFTDE